MAPNKITKSFRSQSERLQAASNAAGVPRTTPPAANGLLQSGCPPISSARHQSGGSRKLNTPTKPNSSSAQCAAAGVATLMPSGPAQAKLAAGAAADPYHFPEDDDDEHQAAVAASHAGRPAPGALAAAPAGLLNPKAKRVKASTDRSRREQQDRLEQHGQQKDQRRVARQLDTQDLLACDSGDENAPVLPFSTSAQPSAAAASKPGALVGGNVQLRQQSSLAGPRKPDIRQFFRKLPASGAGDPQPMPAGMLNHGNTCYLNAILQALLSLPCLALDLGQLNCNSSSGSGTGSSSNPGSSGSSACKLQLPPDGVTAAMVTCLRQYQAACSRARGASDASTAAISPQVVREAMRKRASHWGAARQEDAHEFFTALLNGLADEVQQAQLECIQRSSSTQRRKQPAATAGQLALPSADDAAQACQADEQVDFAADDSQPSHQQERQQQQQQIDLKTAAQMQLPDDLLHSQQQQQQEDMAVVAAEAAAERGSRPPTPACQLPSMSVSQALCPVTRNFLGCLQHTYTCSVCGRKTVQKEQFNHLILDLPQDDDSSSSDGGGGCGLFGSTATAAGGLFGSIANKAPVADLSALLANHFSPETCDKACEGCGAAEVQHTVEHAVRRLPRVLVVQLKRFKWVISKDGFPDCRKMPTPVKPDKQLFLGRLCVPGRPVPPLLAALMPSRLIRSAMEAAGEQPLQQQQQQLGSTGAAAGSNGGRGAAAAAASGAAAVADGGLEGLLQAGDSDADVVTDAAAAATAVGQQYDQEQKQKQPKRLGGLRLLEDAQTSKKPRTVAASSFGATANGSLAGFWHGAGGSAKPKPVLAGSRLKAACSDASASQQQQDEEPDFSYDAALYADGPLDSDMLQGGGCSPQPLRRNNSSSATPVWEHLGGQELSGLADAAERVAAERELEDDLSRALLLSKQEFDQQQQQQQQQQLLGEDEDEGLADGMDGGSFQVPSWIEEQHVPAEAAAPPASPVHAGGPAETPPADFAAELRRQQQQDRQQQRDRQQASAAGAADLHARTPVAAAAGADTAVADGMFAFTPPHADAGQQQQQQQGVGGAMDVDGCAGPSSPALLAPQPDRSGRVSSSTAPGGSQLRPAGQKLGGGGAAAAGSALAAAAAAALQRNGNQGVQPKLLKEVQETGLSEEEQLARAIAESMKEQQQQNGPDASAGVTGAADTSPVKETFNTWLRQQQQPTGSGQIAELGTAAAPMEVDGLDDEDKLLEWALKESAAEHERQQQQQLLKLQQQELIDLSGAASTVPGDPAAGDTAAAAAAGGAVGQGQAGEDSAQQEGQKERKERPPALLLRLLEDSDYEAEQEELRGRSRSSSPSRTALAGAAEGSNQIPSVGIAQGAEQQGEQSGVQPKRRRGRPRKQQGAAGSAAAGADGSEPPAAGTTVKKQGVLRTGVQAEGAAAAAADFLHDAAAGPGSQTDKENCCAAGTGAADTDTVPDRPAGRAAAAAAAGSGAKTAGKSGKGTQQKQRRALKEILGDGSARNAAAGAAAAAAAAADPPQKPPGVSAAVAAAQAAAAAGRQVGAAAAAAAVDEVQELQEGVAAGAVGAWPQDAAASYSLSAVVRHMGELVSVGHFTSDVLNHEIKRWFHYDDSYVRPLSSIEAVRGACQRDGYLFFYVNDAISEN